MINLLNSNFNKIIALLIFNQVNVYKKVSYLVRLKLTKKWIAPHTKAFRPLKTKVIKTKIL